MMAPSLLLNKMPMTPFRVMAAVAGCAAAFLVISALRTTGPEQKLGPMLHNAASPVKRDTVEKTMADPTFWKTVNLRAEEIPAEVNKIAPSVKVQNNTINILGVATFYREATPPTSVAPSGEVVLLLHGAAFKSETWLTLNTINLLAAMGHRVVAIDLPGYGETKGPAPRGNNANFLFEVMNQLHLNMPILVSPSMSGDYSIPLVKQNSNKLGAYIPIAPVGTGFIKSDAPNIKIPTLIIYGEKDKGLGVESKNNLINIPTSQEVVIPNAKHPAYLDAPELFHQLLYNFIKQVHAQKA